MENKQTNKQTNKQRDFANHGDTISRQAAIDALTHKWDGMVTSVFDVINSLPSAQPEKRTENTRKTHACDCIERQAAIDVIRGWVNKALEDWGYATAEIQCFNAIYPLIMALPSAQPERKTAKWQITDAYPHNVYCSECHKRFAQTHWAVWEDGSLPRNFCPNCGAMMQEGEGNGQTDK